MKQFIFSVVFVIVVILVCVITIPLSAIWAVNTLFHTEIEFTLETYLASLILCGIVGSSYTTKSKD